MSPLSPHVSSLPTSTSLQFTHCVNTSKNTWTAISKAWQFHEAGRSNIYWTYWRRTSVCPEANKDGAAEGTHFHWSKKFESRRKQVFFRLVTICLFDIHPIKLTRARWRGSSSGWLQWKHKTEEITVLTFLWLQEMEVEKHRLTCHRVGTVETLLANNKHLVIKSNTGCPQLWPNFVLFNKSGEGTPFLSL